jgi:hypothetical protein
MDFSGYFARLAALPCERARESEFTNSATSSASIPRDSGASCEPVNNYWPIAAIVVDSCGDEVERLRCGLDFSQSNGQLVSSNSVRVSAQARFRDRISSPRRRVAYDNSKVAV